MLRFVGKANLVGIAALPFVVALAYGCWQAARLGLYRPQIVTISRVETLCSIQWRHSSLFRSKTATPWTTDCRGEERRLPREYPTGRADLERGTFVSFTYISPADGSSRPGTLRRAHNDQGMPARSGDRIAIEASLLLAGVFTDWFSGSIDASDVAYNLAPAGKN
jgi:hypothetical protein